MTNKEHNHKETMTPEPTDVRLARSLITLIRDDGYKDCLSDNVLAMALGVVDRHEANLEAGRKQAEERRLAQEETARRWPELAKEGWVFETREYSLAFRSESHFCRETEITINDDDNAPEESEIRIDGGEEWEIRPCKIILALIDAAGRNTTAERLRSEIRRAIESMSVHDGDLPAHQILCDALNSEASNV